nr:biotin transporter BioY [Lachnospiraceae bacterium]
MRAPNSRRIRTIELVLIALMAAVLCIVGPVTIPVGVVPVSTVIVVLYLITYILGTWRAALSCLIYLCIGMIGLPVFAGYSAGPAVLFGPTGGYLIGYLLLIVCSGLCIGRSGKKLFHLIGMMAGLFGCYSVGTAWLMWQSELSLLQAVMTGVMPFVIFDLFKIGAALLVGPMFQKYLRKTNILTS